MEARRAEIYKEIMDEMVEERLAKEQLKKEMDICDKKINAIRREKEQNDIQDYNSTSQYTRRFFKSLYNIWNVLPDARDGDGIPAAMCILATPIWVPPCILGTAVYTIFGSDIPDIPDKKIDMDNPN